MSHNILRLASTVFNTPQLITADSFEPITTYLRSRMASPNGVEFAAFKTNSVQKESPTAAGNIGVLEIEGSLTYKPQWTMCGAVGTSYLELIDDTQELIDSGVDTIVYSVASGGGEAAHMFETANVLKEMLADNGVYSIAYIDEFAASAAYGLSCVMDEVIINPSAQAGSIGALVALLDDSKAMEKKGLKTIYLTSTKGKVPFEADGSFSQSFLDKMQERVIKLGDEFAQHVSENIGIDKETILSWDAQVFDAEKSLELGLVNSIMTHKQFTNYLASKEYKK